MDILEHLEKIAAELKRLESERRRVAIEARRLGIPAARVADAASVTRMTLHRWIEADGDPRVNPGGRPHYNQS